MLERSLRSLVLGAAVLVGLVAPSDAKEAPVFEQDVLPIFRRYCFNCHGKSSPQLGLDLRTARRVLRGSQNGPVIVKGSPQESLLWEKVSTREMPLELFKLRLSDDEIETIRRWIEAGAPSTEATELPADVRAQFARFERDVRPVLEARCVACHGPEEPEAELDLSSLESLVRGSRSGPVIVEGASEKSVLIRKVLSGAMPPPEFEKPLSAQEIRTLTDWIDRGRFADFVDVVPRRASSGDASAASVSLEDRDFWAFRTPQDTTAPAVERAERARTPIDRFALARLETSGLTFSQEASKSTLLRRAYFDLLGLPPTPAQAREFLEDDRPDAYERLVDRLLASPRYGERWGRHWLDVVGYVDTTDKDFDPNTPALSDGYWRYRDYVIEATNKDKPWNQFLVEQLAGDETVDWRRAKRYTPEILERLIATGYLRNVLDATDEDISNLPFDRYEALFMLMDRVSTSTMGMTLACARCHSHKFDPIPQTDYYRFLSLFTAAYNPANWLPPKHRYLYSVSKPKQKEIEAKREEMARSLEELEAKLAELHRPYRERLREARIEQLPEAVRGELKAALAAPEKERSANAKALVKKHEKALAIKETELDAILSGEDRPVRGGLRKKINAARELVASLRLEKLQALWDVGDAPKIRLLHRGDVDFAGPEVSPGFLTVLSAPGAAEAIPSSAAVGETTGLRLAFAEWLTRPDHPLTARVIVNRLWQHHFGRGIVETPGNFGSTGARPTHPELLDWLAVEFQRRDWSAKQLHRLIMTSTVYRQASTRAPTRQSAVSVTAPEATQRAAFGPSIVDPQNRLLWRRDLRRLDAESLRDAILAVSGRANLAMGGPPVRLEAMPSGLQTARQDLGGSESRRSVYLLARRSNPMTFLRVFDFPTIDVNCTRRSRSATPLQSLTMINSEFIVASARSLARRAESLAGREASPARIIEHAYWLTLARAPSASDLQGAEVHVEHLEGVYVEAGSTSSEARARALENLVHMLLCSNEFLYVD